MRQEDKELLLKDLCARLYYYNVICEFTWTDCDETTNGEDVIVKKDDTIRGIDVKVIGIQADYYGEWVDLEHCKPYLRPMSSMTGEEFEEYGNITEHISIGPLDFNIANPNAFDWLNTHHFDYRGLIEKGLAIEVTKENNPYESNM